VALSCCLLAQAVALSVCRRPDWSPCMGRASCSVTVVCVFADVVVKIQSWPFYLNIARHWACVVFTVVGTGRSLKRSEFQRTG
jgi:hypothetical protein